MRKAGMVDNLKRSGYRIVPNGPAENDPNRRLELIYENNKRVGSITRLPQMLEQVIQMTQQTLNAAAASILLFRDNEQELYFEAASGPVGKELHQVKLNT